MADKINIQSGRLEYVSSTGTLDVIVHGNLNVIGNSGNTDITQGSLQVKDVSVITNFGEYGPEVTTGDNIAGLVVDRGMYSLVKLPDPANPDDFPTTYTWAVEKDASGVSLLRTDPSAHPGWQFPSGDPSDPTGGSADVTLPPLTSPAGLTWSEVTFSWDLNYDYLAGDDPAPLPNNPRIINVGDPTGDLDVTAAANVQWVSDKIDEFQNVTIPAEVMLENLANVEDSPAVIGNFLAHDGSEWISTNTVEGNLRLENPSGTEYIELDTSSGLEINTGTTSTIDSVGQLTISSTGDLILQGTTWPSSPGVNGQILVLSGTDLIYSDLTANLNAGDGLTKTGTTNVTFDVGAGTGITVGANTVSFDTVYGDGRYLGINDKADDADLLDGNDSTYYTNASNLVSGILPGSRFNDTSHGNRSGGTLHDTATPSINGFMSSTDKSNLDSLIANNAEENQFAYSNVSVVGQTLISADAKTDTLNVAEGSGIQLTTNGTTDTLTVGLQTTSNRNVDHSAVSITGGNGLTGGGDITTSRSLHVGAGDGITVNIDDVAVDSTVVRTAGSQTIGGGKEFTANLTVSNTSPVLVIKDSDSSGASQVGYVSFRDNVDIENSWVGYGTSLNTDFTITNSLGDVVLSPSGIARVGSNRILTVADEGSGNSLNADTVDNLHANQFLRSDVTDTKNGDVLFTGSNGVSLPTNATQVTKTSGNWITSGAAGASNTISNLTLHSDHGIGFASTISGNPIPQGENAVYINIRNGNVVARGTISEGGSLLSAKYLGINDTADNSVLLNGNTEAFYRNASNLNDGILPTVRFNDTSHGNRAGGTLHANATTSVSGFMSASDKMTLDNLASTGGEPNQNAFSSVSVSGETAITADAPSDNLLVSAGTGITLSTVAVNNELVITNSSPNVNQNIIAGNGLTDGGSSSTVTLNVGAGTGITVAADTVGLDVGNTRNSDHASISINSGNGLTGGGNITASRSLEVGQGDGIAVSANDVAVDSTVVRTSGSQTIGGVKQFTDNISVENTQPMISIVDTDSTGFPMRGAISYKDSGGVERGFVGFVDLNTNFIIDNDLGDIILAPTGDARVGSDRILTVADEGVGNGLNADLLDGQHGSFYQNQDAFSNIVVSGQSTVAADSTTDTLTLVAGSNVTITTNATTDSITISSSGGTITSVNAGDGLTGGGSSGSVTLDVVGGDGITANTNDIAVDATVVRTNLNQVIGALKTFSEPVSFSSGTAPSPSIRFSGDTNTGIYHPTTDQVGVACGGLQTAWFQTNGLHIGSSLFVSDGSQTTPSITFDNDTDTGFYRSIAGAIGITIGGSTIGLLHNTGIVMSSGKSLFASDGSVSAPSIRFDGDTNTGIYNRTDGEVSISCNGVLRSYFNPSGLTVDGSVTATSYNTTSSLKYKKNIEKFDNALDKVMAIDVITYKRKDSDDTKRYLGVSAESLAEVVPELVQFKDGEPDSVNYAQGFALVIKAMQEQEERLLKNRLKKFFKNLWKKIINDN